jgi:hypothetical protein
MWRFRWGLLTLVMGFALMACGHWPFTSDGAALVETEIQQVAACGQVGALSETLDTDRIVTPLARREMFEEIERRAQALGATHLVWIYRTDQAAAARAFRCPQ